MTGVCEGVTAVWGGGELEGLPAPPAGGEEAPWTGLSEPAPPTRGEVSGLAARVGDRGDPVNYMQKTKLATKWQGKQSVIDHVTWVIQILPKSDGGVC